MTRQPYRLALVYFWMILIFVLSSRPDLPSNDIYVLDFLLKKTAHFLEYGLLFFFWFRALGKAKWPQAIIYSLIYAFTDEIHQLFVPGRTGSLRDVGIDFLGILSAALLVIKLRPWNRVTFPLPVLRLRKSPQN